MDETDIEKEKIIRLFDWSKGETAGPIKVDIELHRRCNLSCLSCSRRHDEKFGAIDDFSKTIEMNSNQWVDIVKQAAKLGVWQWHVAGGGDPPFVQELFIPVVKEIKKHDMFGILTTNGTNLSDDNIKMLVELGWDRIHFSIDGPDAATHDYLRQLLGAFDKATATILQIQALKKKLGKHNPQINMNTVLSKKNYRKIPDQVKLAKKLGIGYMFIEPLIIYSEHGKKLKLDDKEQLEFQKYLKEAISLAKRLKIDGNFTSLVSNLDEELIEKSSSMHKVVKKDAAKYEENSFLSVPCYDPWFHMCIKADGRVISCDVCTDEGENIKDKSLEDIWYGSFFADLRQSLLSKKLSRYCAQCNPSHTTQRRWLREMMEKQL